MFQRKTSDDRFRKEQHLLPAAGKKRTFPLQTNHISVADAADFPGKLAACEAEKKELMAVMHNP